MQQSNKQKVPAFVFVGSERQIQDWQWAMKNVEYVSEKKTKLSAVFLTKKSKTEAKNPSTRPIWTVFFKCFNFFSFSRLFVNTRLKGIPLLVEKSGN